MKTKPTLQAGERTLSKTQLEVLRAICRCEIPEVSTRTLNALVEHGMAKISGGCLVPTEYGKHLLARMEGGY